MSRGVSRTARLDGPEPDVLPEPDVVTLRSRGTRGRAVLTDPVGLHARPAIRLTRLAKRFAAQIRLRAGSAAEWTDSKSIVRVMALKVRSGAVVELRAEGIDAAEAVAALVALIEGDFADGAAE